MFNPNDIFNIQTQSRFNEIALKVFQFQYEYNMPYRKFSNLLERVNPEISNLSELTYLPVSLFKNHKIISGDKKFQKVFSSSRTSGSVPSKHYVKYLDIYKYCLMKCFQNNYGGFRDLTILALLPSYLERKDSSLVYMMEILIKEYGNERSGFFLNNTDELVSILRKNEKRGAPTILIGVTFALLDLAKSYREKLHSTIIMETGGMKGKRKEMSREEVHSVLKNAFGLKAIHSEYGMTELLSQAYSKRNGLFFPPPWMAIVIRDMRDPLKTGLIGKRGLINIIDLANICSCSFLATDDIGIAYPDGSFKVLGRFDNSEVRGCNLMVEN
jgi:hypothetical protein